MYKMITDLAEEKRALSNHNDGDIEVPTFVDNLPAAPLKTKMSQKYLGDQTIVYLAINEWWHRGWCVQELVLSSNAVIMTGRHVISWEDLRTGVDHGLDLQIWGQVAFGFLMNPVTVPYLSMRALISRYSRSKELGDSATNLLHLLMYCRHRDATDPRDKVYAVLGLLRLTHSDAMSSLNIPIGYDLEVAYVYRRVSEEIIRKMGNLDILGVVPVSDRPKLPSWATDWSNTDKIETPLMQDSLNRTRMSHATKGAVASVQFTDNGLTMTLSGYSISTIASLAAVLPNPVLKAAFGSDPHDLNGGVKVDEKVKDLHFPDGAGRIRIYWITFKFIITIVLFVISAISELYVADFRAMMSVFVALFAWERFAIDHPPKNEGVAPDSVYWQTLCTATYKNGDMNETKAMFDIWSDILQPVRKFMEKHPKFCANHPFWWFVIYMKACWNNYGEFWPYITCAHHRRLGSAANGWLCLIPKRAEVGDIIVLAKGVRVPLVVRWNVAGYYTFIGEAYIHGIMNGEAWDESKCVNLEIR